MKSWKWLSWSLGVLGALFILAASVPFDDLTKNLTSYIEPFGLDHLFAALADEATQTKVFRFGIAFILGAVTAQIAKAVIYAKREKDAGSDERADHWAERQRLEISVLANVSTGREPTASPIDKDPENSRLRELKDAIETSQLDAQIDGEKPNVMSTVTLDDFTLYVAATNKPYWVEVLHRWQEVQNPPAGELAAALKTKRISLLKFLDIVNGHNWPVLDPQGYGGFDLIHGLSEAAGLGDISMLGKPIDQQMPKFAKLRKLQRITTEAWQTMEIDPLSCFNFKNPGVIVGLKDDNAETATKLYTGSALGFQSFVDLYIETGGLLEWLDNDADAYRGHYSRTYGD